MRRSTAAALGTLTGAALIVGVRLSVSAPIVTAAPPAVDLSGDDSGSQPSADTASPGTTEPTPEPTRERRERSVATPRQTPTDRPTESSGGRAGGTGSSGSGLRDGVFRGPSQSYAFGAIQVSIRISGGTIVAADATYPTQGESATINPPAIANLKRQTLKATSAKNIDTVSGATLTSGAYRKSLQAALDQAGA